MTFPILQVRQILYQSLRTINTQELREYQKKDVIKKLLPQFQSLIVQKQRELNGYTGFLQLSADDQEVFLQTDSLNQQLMLRTKVQTSQEPSSEVSEVTDMMNTQIDELKLWYAFLNAWACDQLVYKALIEELINFVEPLYEAAQHTCTAYERQKEASGASLQLQSFLGKRNNFQSSQSMYVALQGVLVELKLLKQS